MSELEPLLVEKGYIKIIGKFISPTYQKKYVSGVVVELEQPDGVILLKIEVAGWLIRKVVSYDDIVLLLQNDFLLKGSDRLFYDVVVWFSLVFPIDDETKTQLEEMCQN